MAMKKLTRLTMVLALLLLGVSGLKASPVNILWYTGGAQPSNYDSTIRNNFEHNAALTGNDWTITFWDGSGSRPASFTGFDVMVVASEEGPWGGLPPDYTDLFLAGVNESTFGDRVMLTGQDADWHFIDDLTPGPSPFDGPTGFLVNSINWAGSGTVGTMGAVVLDASSSVFSLFTGAGQMYDDKLCPVGGSTDPNDPNFDPNCFGRTDNVKIPGEFAGYPLNAGLSSTGLSSWGEAAHKTWQASDPALWTAINADGNSCPAVENPSVADCDRFVTLVKASQAAGGTTRDAVPEPDTLVLLSSGVLGFIFAYRKMKS
jgi:hypothetical protein